MVYDRREMSNYVCILYTSHVTRECIVKVAYFNIVFVLLEEFLLESFPTNIQNISFDGSWS